VIDLKFQKKEKNRKEVALIADFEMEYGQFDHWAPGIEQEFNRKWDEIQSQYSKSIRVK
jgi:hypothetical protein